MNDTGKPVQIVTVNGAQWLLLLCAENACIEREEKNYGRSNDKGTEHNRYNFGGK